MVLPAARSRSSLEIKRLKRARQKQEAKHKPLHPRLRGTGIQASEVRTHLKNMTTDNTGEPVFWWLNNLQESRREEEFGFLS